METKADNPIHLLPAGQLSPLVDVYFELSHLKQLYRQGWMRRGVPANRCESVAEHTFGVATLALFLCASASPELDLLKVLRLALLHDIGEIYAGDLIPADGINLQEKYRLEEQSVRQVLAKLQHGADFMDLWEEYERAETAEARFVRQLDRLEMALQASVYARQGLISGEEFFASAIQELVDPDLMEIALQAQAIGSLRYDDE